MRSIAYYTETKTALSEGGGAMKSRRGDPREVLALAVFVGLIALAWYFGLLPVREAGGQVQPLQVLRNPRYIQPMPAANA